METSSYKIANMESKEMYPNTEDIIHGRGYFGIGIENVKTTRNLGTVWRSAQIMGADFMFVIGERYEYMITDTMKSWKHIPLFYFKTIEQFLETLPKDSKLIGVELDERSVPICTFKHPQRAIYLMGAEDKGLSKTALKSCDSVVQLPGKFSLNVSAAASIVLYDRYLKGKTV
jgi:tRNA G18 (ribose-2'-O)-methylase SpoU